MGGGRERGGKVRFIDKVNKGFFFSRSLEIKRELPVYGYVLTLPIFALSKTKIYHLNFEDYLYFLCPR